MVQFELNGESISLDAPDDMMLLWAVRDLLNLTGSKFGCGRGLCGACTMHIDGQSVRSCSTPLAAAKGKKVTTIEGLSQNGELHPVQIAWMEENVPQCGYCQSGQIMSAVALLRDNPKPTDQDIRSYMSGNVCRCGTYSRIRKAIHRAAGNPQGEPVQTWSPDVFAAAEKTSEVAS